MQVENIDASLGDGVAIINLIEILSKRRAPRFLNRPKTLNERCS